MYFRIWRAGIFLAAGSCLPGNLQAQEDVPAVPYAQVPEIVAYVKNEGMLGFGHKNVTVAKVDLNTPPDGVAEYIVHLNHPCGSGGCATDVVRIKPSGKFERLAGILSYGFGLAYTSTNGMRDLLTEGRSGKFTWRFRGQQYKARKGHAKAAITRPKGWRRKAEAHKKEASSPQGGASVSPQSGLSEPPLDPHIPDLMDYKKVPGIRDFVERLGKGRIMAGTLVGRFDIDVPSDNTDEYILRVGVADFCQDGTCEYKIVRLESSGKLREIFSSGVETFRFATTSSNGYRDLVTEAPSGRYLWKFDGKNYQSTKLRSKRIAQRTKPRKPNLPGCIGEYGWRSGYERGRRSARGYAVFGSCTDQMNTILQMACGDGERGVRVDIDVNPDRSGSLQVHVTVDATSFVRSAKTYFSELSGHHHPFFRLSRRDPILRALTSGKSATVEAGKARFQMHLNGSSVAIRTMLRTCRR